jgi:pilus assembly protein Flp/PilA
MTRLNWIVMLVTRAVTSRDQRGASLVEYALLVALIAIACLVAVQFFGGATSTSFSRTGASLANT